MRLALMRLNSLLMGQRSLKCGNLSKAIVQVTSYITKSTQSRPVITRYLSIKGKVAPDPGLQIECCR